MQHLTLKGVSALVYYTHNSTTLTEPIRCNVESIVENEITKDNQKTFLKFHGLYTATKPNRGDVIMYNNERYYFDKVVSEIADCTYDVLAYQQDNRPTVRGRR